MGLLTFRVPKFVAAAIIGASAGGALWAVRHSWRIQRAAAQALVDDVEREHQKATPPELEQGTVADEDRVAPARTRAEPSWREICREAALSYPPRELFLRAFKREAEIEVWARDDAAEFRLLETFPITASSGKPGPKRKEGDRQVPEGFYAIDLFNPKSSFHLSMRVNYPNASDRVLSDPVTPGGDIYIHGANCSIGCLPLGDANIELLYVLALDVTNGGRQEIPIHIFPTRMAGKGWDELAHEHAAESTLAAFWDTLKTGYDAFESTHRLPSIKVLEDGRYLVAPPPTSE